MLAKSWLGVRSHLVSTPFIPPATYYRIYMVISAQKGKIQKTSKNKSHQNVFSVWSNAAINDIRVCLLGILIAGSGPASTEE